jgi:hypothetical protein
LDYRRRYTEMAFVCVYTATGGEQSKIYNVSMAVGKNAPNRKDDVMLVQYMLKRIYEKPVYKKGTFSKQQTVMVVDGLCGPITIQWITRFQLDCRDTFGGHGGVVDGRVDRSSASTTYTIDYINDAFRLHYSEIWENMPVHPDVPAEVRAALLLSLATL